MVRVKPVRRPISRRVIYTVEHFQLLNYLRKEAAKVMASLVAKGIVPFLHGSVVRGDVTTRSDIDVVIMHVAPSYKVELALSDAGHKQLVRLITMATPSHALKATIKLKSNLIVTFPVVKLRRLEREFYRFGGICSLVEARSECRKPGVDKRLMLIEPTKRGHLERTIIGSEMEVSELLGVSLDLIEERERVLLRRDDVGRRGVYMKKYVPPDVSIEDWAERILRQNPPAGKKFRRKR